MGGHDVQQKVTSPCPLCFHPFPHFWLPCCYVLDALELSPRLLLSGESELSAEPTQGGCYSTKTQSVPDSALIPLISKPPGLEISHAEPGTTQVVPG